MTCEATWMLASDQSTILPFIHTFPVPLKAMNAPDERVALQNDAAKMPDLTMCYWLSLQKGQRAAREGSGLRQFQQKRLATVSAVRRGVEVRAGLAAATPRAGVISPDAGTGVRVGRRTRPSRAARMSSRISSAR